MALSYLQFFKVGEIMVSNYGHLMSTQGHFHIKLPLILTSQINFGMNTYGFMGGLCAISGPIDILYKILVSLEIETYDTRS